MDTSSDLHAVLHRSVAALPEMVGRTTVVCDTMVAEVDPQLLEQIVTHLLHLQADLPAGSRTRVTAVSATGGLVLTVEDDELSTDVKEHRRPGHDRTAMRLAQVSQLVRLHGGVSWIEPADDDGLRFVVELPTFGP